MHLNRFDLNLLIALDALLQERNVTSAAERVFLSQPAMSAALRKLRDYFGDPLLVRIGRDLELTPRGLALVEPVREALLGVQATLRSQPSFDPATATRTFGLMAADFLVPWLMPLVLQRLLRDAPGIRWRIENWSRTGPTRLAYGEIDFVVGVDNPGISVPGSMARTLVSVDLAPIRWVCAVSADHPEVRDRLTREQFLRLPHVYVRVPGDPLPIEEVVQRQLQVSLDVRVTTQNALEVPFILRGTPLIAILSASLATLLAPSASIRTFEVPAGLLAQRRVSLFWHRRSELDPGHAWLRNLMRDCLRADEAPKATAVLQLRCLGT